MKLLYGLLLCVAAVASQGVTELTDRPKDPSVLRIVSTLISPYLEVRPVEEEQENLDEQNTVAAVTAARMRRDADVTGPTGVGVAEPEPTQSLAPESAVEPGSSSTAGPVAEPGAKTSKQPETVTKADVKQTTESKAAVVPIATSTVGLAEPSPTIAAADDANVTSSQDVMTTAADVVTSPSTAAMTTLAGTTAETATTAAPEPMTPYEGFIPDLMDLMLPHIPNITAYEIYTVSADEENSAYTNMLNEVISGRADVAAGPMTVTMYKEKFVDFTYPFQRVEATIVMHKLMEEKFQTLEDLVNQDPNGDDKLVNYGVRIDGAIHQVLKDSEDPLHKKMVKHLNTNEVALKATNAKGINRARYGGYAFIIEGSIADWVVGQPPCTLVGIKAGFFKRQYAFAVPQRSEWRDKLNIALIEVDDKLGELSEKWLKPGECSGATSRTPPILLSSLLLSLVTILVARFM